jgi:hypothetical protein
MRECELRRDEDKETACKESLNLTQPKRLEIHAAHDRH